MATKLKNISRNRLTKIIVFALSLLMLWLAVNDLGDFLYENKAKDISLMAESLFADSYFETSHAHSRIHNGTYYVLERASDGFSASPYLISQLDLLEYAVTDEEGNTLITSDSKYNIDQFRKGNYIVCSNGTITEVSGDISESLIGAFNYRADRKAVISFPDEYWGEGFENYTENRDAVRNLASIEFNRLIVFLVCVIFLIMVAGRKPEDEKVHTTFPDNLWSEIHLFALLMLFFAGCMVFVLAADVSCHSYTTTSTFNLTMVLCNAGIIVVYALFMWIFLSLVRKIKARTFIKSTCLGWMWRKIKAVFKAVSAFCGEFIRNFTGVEFKDMHFAAGFHKIQVRFVTISVIMAILISLCTSVMFAHHDGFLFLLAALFLAVIECFIIWHYIKKTTRYSQSMARLLVQIDKVSSGNLDYDAGIGEDDYLIESSTKLANITEGLSHALAEQMKGERMKIELITNVSHDLKTPLTSIISYIDLLRKEEMNDAAKDYVNILSHKADRLKGIVSDLFDLAKTNSGNAQLEIKPLDFSRLTHQLLADMEDKIAESGMKIKLNLPDSPAVITADGKKLSRALQNVVDNALKYSLSGSRIYIDLVKNEGNAILSVKNTSAYEMDFTADEIMQRFVRGDKNRSSDGSGLGLSIAQSFTQVSGGSFDVMIDGDQFKTVFTFPMTDEQMNNESGDII